MKETIFHYSVSRLIFYPLFFVYSQIVQLARSVTSTYY